MKKHLKYLMLVGLVSFLALTACTAATAQASNNDEYISLGEESQLAIAYVDVEFFYVSKTGELTSTTLLTRGTAEDVFEKWSWLNNVADVVLMNSYTESNCTTVDDGIATQRILGDEFILQVTLSNGFAIYRHSENGALLEEALMKTFYNYLSHLTEFYLIIDGYAGQEDKSDIVYIPQNVIEISKAFYIGASKTDIDYALNITPLRVYAAYDGTVTYRYDIFAEEGYEFFDALDSLDIEGMRAGLVEVVVFVFFDYQDRLVWYNMYFIVPDGTIYLMRDGGIQHVIPPAKTMP